MKILLLLALFTITGKIAHGAEGCKQANLKGCISEYETTKSVKQLARISHLLENHCREEGKYCDYALITCDFFYAGRCEEMANSVKNNEQKFRPFAEKSCALKIGSLCYELGRIEVDANNMDKARAFFEKACNYEDWSGCSALIWPREQAIKTPRNGSVDERGLAIVQKICKTKPKMDACRALDRKASLENTTPQSSLPGKQKSYDQSPFERTPEDYIEVCKNGDCCRAYTGGLTVDVKPRSSRYGTVSPVSVETLLDKAWKAKALQRRLSGNGVAPKHSIRTGAKQTRRSEVDLADEPKKSPLWSFEKELLGLCKSSKTVSTIDNSNDAESGKQLITLLRSDALPAWAFSMHYHISYAEKPPRDHDWWLKFTTDSVVSELNVLNFESGQTSKTITSATVSKDELIKLLERTQLFLQTFGPKVSETRKFDSLIFSFRIEFGQQRIGYLRNIPEGEDAYLAQVEKMFAPYQELHKAENKTDPWDEVVSRWKRDLAAAQVAPASERKTGVGMTVKGYEDLSPKANENLLQGLRSCVFKKADLDAELGSNFDAIRTKIRLTPVEDPDKSGVLRGFKVTEIEYESIIGVLGLLDGDLLVEIGGVALDQREKSDLLFQELKVKKGQIEFAVVRGEKRRTFRCNTY